MSVRRPTRFLEYDLAPAAGARRYEDGTPNTAGIYGLEAALALVEEIGVDAIASRVLALSKRVRDGGRARGLRLACAAGGDEASGIVSFLVDDADGLAAALAQRGVIVAAREGRLRVATHYFNSEEEVDRLLDAFR
jgi:selenocysteine lyase/cysteine desulfurase